MIPDIIKTESTILRDESLFSGKADSTSQPDTPEAVCQIVKYCRSTGIPITVRGSLTAMNGAGVPVHGHTLSTERMCLVEYDADTATLWAQAGATFQKIGQAARKASGGKREFPAAPTEKTATLGGALSFATSGIRALAYGTMAQQVLELEYCDAAGNLHRISREDPAFQDLLGSEGMYCVITGARLATAPVPEENWGLIFFLDSDVRAAAFASGVRNLPGVTGLEYLDSTCLELLRTLGRSIATVTRLPELPGEAVAAVYVELEAEGESQMEEFAQAILLEADQAGADPDLSWSAGAEEVERFRELLHGAQECVNLRTAQAHQRDTAVTRLTYPVCAMAADPLARRAELKAAGLEAAVFGHWDNTLPLGIHVFPEDGQQYRTAKKILKRWHQDDLAHGRNAAPHRGIGKVYRDIFCRETKKKIYDPEGLFNPGND